MVTQGKTNSETALHYEEGLDLFNRCFCVILNKRILKDLKQQLSRRGHLLPRAFGNVRSWWEGYCWPLVGEGQDAAKRSHHQELLAPHSTPVGEFCLKKWCSIGRP